MEWCYIYRKKWNLDGPDGFHCYWNDLSKEKRFKKTRQSGGGSVMTWGAFCSNGIFKLVLVSGNMDSKQYTDMLTEYFLEDFFRIAGNRAIFQHDNVPIHVPRHSKAFFSDKNVVLMDRPALSPDLYPIENLWSIVAWQVYGQSKQYDSKGVLDRCNYEIMVRNRWSNCQKSDRVDEKSLHRSDCSERRKNKVLNYGICDFILVALSFCNMLILSFNGKIIK